MERLTCETRAVVEEGIRNNDRSFMGNIDQTDQLNNYVARNGDQQDAPHQLPVENADVDEYDQEDHAEVDHLEDVVQGLDLPKACAVTQCN